MALPQRLTAPLIQLDNGDSGARMGLPVQSVILRTLGENIRSARDAVNIGQSELATLCQTTPPTVHKWETNKAVPDLASLFKVAVACRTTIERLVMAVDAAYTEWTDSRPTSERIVALADHLTPDQQTAVLSTMLVFVGRGALVPQERS
jgi:transcriptional regulator with XRE-family HTH domain